MGKKQKHKPQSQDSTVSETELERRHQRSLLKWHALVGLGDRALKVSGQACKWLCVVACVYFGVTRPLTENAGTETVIKYVVRVADNIHVSVTVSWVLTAASWILAFGLWRLLMRDRRRKDARIAEFEKQKDPNRTSSLLNVGGDATQGESS